MFEFNKSYLLYIGIGVVIVLVAFFAYQELTKHKMEIQKLRYESEKLRKIIHAYNMRQWQQDPSEELIDEDSDEEDTELEPDTSHTDIRLPSNSNQVQEILQETLSSFKGEDVPAPVVPTSSVKIVSPENEINEEHVIEEPVVATIALGGGASSASAAVSVVSGVPNVKSRSAMHKMHELHELHEQEPLDDLPDVESFGRPTQRHPGNSDKTSEEEEPEEPEEPEESGDRIVIEDAPPLILEEDKPEFPETPKVKSEKTEEPASAFSFTQLKEIANKHGVKGRSKKDLITKLTDIGVDPTQDIQKGQVDEEEFFFAAHAQ